MPRRNGEHPRDSCGVVLARQERGEIVPWGAFIGHLPSVPDDARKAIGTATTKEEADMLLLRINSPANRHYE